jgi:hypothetical protein
MLNENIDAQKSTSMYNRLFISTKTKINDVGER